MKYNASPHAVEPESGTTISSCLERVIFTLVLLLVIITIAGAGISSDSAASGECQVSEKFPGEVRRWCSLITREALENDIHPDLVAALIWQESGGNSRAYSHSGAVGLMQVMPHDGKATSFECPEGPCFANRPSSNQLRNPSFNIDYGTRLLKDLIDENQGNLRDALRAYGPMDVGYSYADTVLSLYQQYGAE